MAVIWEPYLSINLQPVSTQDIAHLEQKWGVSFPEDYKALLTAHQGMAPHPAVFNVGRSSSVFNVLLTLKSHEGHESYSVEENYEALRPHVPNGVFPFADTPGGESLCFDYRTRPEQPQVVFVTVECDIHFVADSLSEFLNGLHE